MEPVTIKEEESYCRELFPYMKVFFGKYFYVRLGIMCGLLLYLGSLWFLSNEKRLLVSTVILYSTFTVTSQKKIIDGQPHIEHSEQEPVTDNFVQGAEKA